jgi:3D (Asp-Asp-Asp) domain-containing protein
VLYLKLKIYLKFKYIKKHMCIIKKGRNDTKYDKITENNLTKKYFSNKMISIHLIVFLNRRMYIKMNPLEKSIRRYISFKMLVVAVIFVLAMFLSAFVYQGVDDGNQEVYINESIRSYKSSFAQFLTLKENSLLGQYDSNEYENNQNEIYNERPIPVILQHDGKEYRVMTTRDTTDKVLVENNLRLEGMDRLEGVNGTDKIYPDMRIKIVRVRKVEEFKDVEIKYTKEYIDNEQIDGGKEVVKVKGESGKKKINYSVIYEDGKEVKRDQIKETIIKEPVKEVIERGTKSVLITSNGNRYNYKKILNVNATGYTASYSDTGKSPGDPGFGITCTGIPVRKGVIAVDPNVIPLGSKLYIESLNGEEDYGYAIAADTGGAIKGNKIDLYFETRAVALNWGYRGVRVYVLN